MAACRRTINDHRLVSIGPPRARRPFRPEDAAAIHARDKAFIEAELARPFAGPTVVVTHHAPHPSSVAARYARDPVTPGFVSNLEETILRGRPALWVHGHVHHACDYRVGDTRVVANPKGYGPKRAKGPPENAAFDPALVVEVAVPDAAGHGPKTLAVLRANLAPPTLQIACWTLIRVRVGGDRHLLGYRAESGRARTTSPIKEFDRARRLATTSSGGMYVLVGPPAEKGLDNPVVLAWLTATHLSRCDVEIIGEDDL